MTELSTLPSGLIQVMVGVGIPSDTHFNVTVWPIHDSLLEDVIFPMVGGSENERIAYKSNR